MRKESRFTNFWVRNNKALGSFFVFNKFILQVLDRGEKIELLVDKTENLRSQVSKWILYCSILKNMGYVL